MALKLKRLMQWLWLGLLLGGLSACGQTDWQRESYVFGTRVQITVSGVPEKQAAPVVDAALAELDRWHASLHAWQDSPLARLNQAFARGETGRVTPEIAELIALSQQHWQLTDGLFNPAIGGLVQLWGFHSDSLPARLPPAAQRQRWLAAAPTPMAITLHGMTARSDNAHVRLDFGGMAKGWALDKLAARLQAAGINNALINIGGNIRALGQHEGRPWRVGLQHPRQPQALLELDLHDGEAIGTSGDYQRFFVSGGRRYHHVLDPRTGEPATAASSATVLVQPRPRAGLLSDVASKPLFIGGPARSTDLAARYGLHTWLIVTADGKVYLSEAMRARVRWLEPAPASISVQP